MEKAARATPLTGSAIHVRLLGRLTVFRDGVELPLPASRKARALLAFLAIAPVPVTRTRLCELLWDAPNDPRGELRWCLSKLRGVLDEPRPRIQTRSDTIALDLTGCFVDAAEIARITQTRLAELDLRELGSLHALFTGEFAEGLETDRNPEFTSWLSTQRRRFRVLHVAVLEQLVARDADRATDESFEYLGKWLQLSPFDQRAHQTLLDSLLLCGRVREAEEHLATTIRLFEAEGVDWIPIREFWKAARTRAPDAYPVSQVSSSGVVARAIDAHVVATTGARRASICVMPFVDRTLDGAPRAALAAGLTEDIITRLAKLRILFVIARGSVFALGERNIPPEEAGRLLDVDYVASGSLRRCNDRITVTVELAEARVSRIVWVEELTYKMDDALAAPDDISNRIVASIAGEIEAAERHRAMLKPPNSLNAWEAYHRGLWHMYRFNEEDNARAAHFFRMALRQDRTFARAHAGLSFTHFQNAFLHRTAERSKEIDRAYATAGESLNADDRDPTAHWAMGRALWLRGSQDDALMELEASVSLSPNFALGHYSLGFVHGQSGEPRVAIASADYSRQLSPFDPLLFAFSARALGHFRLGQYEEAAAWAVKGAARPNAHVHILAIAANCLAAAGRLEEARTFVAAIHGISPNYEVADFLTAFRFAPDAAELFRQSAARIDLK
ncbi:MAG: BTAD domain-containing putative transcriptional regulator [Steroidobacter sp.]